MLKQHRLGITIMQTTQLKQYKKSSHNVHKKHNLVHLNNVRLSRLSMLQRGLPKSIVVLLLICMVTWLVRLLQEVQHVLMLNHSQHLHDRQQKTARDLQIVRQVIIIKMYTEKNLFLAPRQQKYHRVPPTSRRWRGC